MGLKRMIRDRIPQPWLHVLREQKVVTEYIALVYATFVSKKSNNAENTKNRIFKIKRALVEGNPSGFSTSFWYSFNNVELLTDAQRAKWEEIDRKIQNYKISCT